MPAFFSPYGNGSPFTVGVLVFVAVGAVLTVTLRTIAWRRRQRASP